MSIKNKSLIYHVFVWVTFLGLYIGARWHNLPVTISKSNEELINIFSEEKKSLVHSGLVNLKNTETVSFSAQ